jgi:hypothetical protein
LNTFRRRQHLPFSQPDSRLLACTVQYTGCDGASPCSGIYVNKVENLCCLVNAVPVVFAASVVVVAPLALSMPHRWGKLSVH